MNQQLTIQQQDRAWRAAARIDTSPAALEARCSLAFKADHDDFGPTRETVLESDGVALCRLVAHPQSPAASPGVEIQVPAGTADPAAVLDEGLILLGLGLDDLAWVDPGLRFTPWEVWREDDHGNRYLVTVCRCRADAARLEAAYEAKGHKQFYWIQKALGGERR